MASAKATFETGIKPHADAIDRLGVALRDRIVAAGERISRDTALAASRARYILIGLVAGLIARAIKPGNDAMGWIMTILLGIGGSLLAGLVTSRGSADFSRAGCLASVVGAAALIFVGRLIGWG